MSAAPRYRADTAGRLAAVKAEAVDAMRNEIANADHFLVAVEDSAVAKEYAEMLTESELRACFKKAAGHASVPV